MAVASHGARPTQKARLRLFVVQALVISLFVTLPNVNPIHEVVNLMSASRSYDANASAVETLKTMAQRALDIAR